MSDPAAAIAATTEPAVAITEPTAAAVTTEPAVATTEPTATIAVTTETVTASLNSARQANIDADELTVAEVETLFAEQYTTAAPSAKPTPVMNENEMDALLRTIGEEADNQKHTWYPSWAATTAPGPRAGDDDPRELEQIVRDIEISIATIDDTTVDTRDRVKELTDEVKILQSQITEMEDGFGSISAQNVALTNEVRELRAITVSMRQHIATLIRQLLRTPALGAASIAVNSVGGAATGTAVSNTIAAPALALDPPDSE